jgi:hypothetical protein
MSNMYSEQQIVCSVPADQPVITWDQCGNHFIIHNCLGRFCLSQGYADGPLWLAEQLERIAIEIRVGLEMARWQRKVGHQQEEDNHGDGAG